MCYSSSCFRSRIEKANIPMPAEKMNSINAAWTPNMLSPVFGKPANGILPSMLTSCSGSSWGAPIFPVGTFPSIVTNGVPGLGPDGLPPPPLLERLLYVLVNAAVILDLVSMVPSALVLTVVYLCEE